MTRSASMRGFTLLEVLVALVIVALGMSALLETLNQSARNVMALRDKTVAEWIAMNQIALARLSLTAPGTGRTQGDVQNCGNGNWHWQQQISAIDAIPGLLTITVSVRRTGTATPGASQNHPVQPPGATPGATGSLAAAVTLGPTAALGSVSSLSTAGCASVEAPGSSLGNGDAPGLGSMPSLGASSLGSTSAADVGASVDASIASAVAGTRGSTAGNGSGSSAGGWLVTVTGFRGNSLAVPSGQTPDWIDQKGLSPNANGGVTPVPGIPGFTGSTP